MIYLIWIGVVLVRYPACKWFADLKRRRREAWRVIFELTSWFAAASFLQPKRMLLANISTATRMKGVLADGVCRGGQPPLLAEAHDKLHVANDRRPSGSFSFFQSSFAGGQRIEVGRRSGPAF